ncbi:MAG: disulfide bond formation protein B [Candidatus Paceibacterota bacterium]
MFDVALIDQYLGLASVAMQVLGVGFLALYFLRSKFADLGDISSLLEKWGMWLAFLLTLGSAAMTLFYSEILGFAPCGLCWLQRVFLYPQVFLFAVALWKQDRRVADYSIVLSTVGVIVALYQHYLQMGGTDVIPCPATGVTGGGITADCAQRFFFEFGYITFPLMSAVLFAFLIVLMLFVRSRRTTL